MCSVIPSVHGNYALSVYSLENSVVPVVVYGITNIEREQPHTYIQIYCEFGSTFNYSYFTCIV